MDDLQDRMARVARDTMMELVSRGIPALPRHYHQVFIELCKNRGLPTTGVDEMPTSAAKVPDASPGLDAEVATLILTLGDLVQRAAPSQPGVAALVEVLRSMSSAASALDRESLVSLLRRVDQLNLEFQSRPATPSTDVLMRRVGELLRALVPLADPEGVEKETVLPALGALASAKAPDDCLPALDALGSFAATRRKSVANELLNAKVAQRRSAELQVLADTVVEFLGRLLPDAPEVEAVLASARARMGKADAKGLQEIRVELTSNFLRFQGTAVPVQEQKTVIKGVLRTLADQLAHASIGSEQFERSAQDIRRRVEAANDLTELRELQVLLVNEAGSAAAEAGKMRHQLGELSSQVRVSQEQIGSLERALTETKQAMNVDPLTRVPNRRALNDWVESTLYPQDKPPRAYSLLVLDLDHFKNVNDTHGHLAGDAVLAETAKRVKLGIRDVDLLARYGGEEFVLVLPDCDLHIARAVADRMCQLVARRPVVHDGTTVPVTTSIGVATARPNESFREVFERADQCVYLAKQGGRNRAVTELSLSSAAPP